MLADCSGCDPRNPYPGKVVAAHATRNLYPPSTEVDYRGRDVSVQSILQVLTGHHPPGTPASRRMDSTRNSTVLLYLTGHGGDGFLKLHDQSELLSTDVAAAVKNMHASGRYKELLLVLDTCQAATLYGELQEVPGWAGIASSKLGQSSYALRSDPGVGAHLVDEFSHYLSNYLDGLPVEGAGSSLTSMLRYLRAQRMSSEIAVESSKLGRSLDDVSVMEYFGRSGKKGRVGWVVAGGRREIEKGGKTMGTAEVVTERNQQLAKDANVKVPEKPSVSPSVYDLLLNAGS